MSTITNKEQFELLQSCFRQLNVVVADAPSNAMAERARKARNAVRDEILEIIQRDLTANTDAYAVLNGPAFRDQIRDLQKLKEEIEELMAGVERFTSVLNWVTSIIPLIP